MVSPRTVIWGDGQVLPGVACAVLAAPGVLRTEEPGRFCGCCLALALPEPLLRDRPSMSSSSTPAGELPSPALASPSPPPPLASCPALAEVADDGAVSYTHLRAHET